MRYLILLLMLCLFACHTPKDNEKSQQSVSTLSEQTIHLAIDSLKAKTGATYQPSIEKGIRHIASLWRVTDGNEQSFVHFCMTNYISDNKERDLLLTKLSTYLESLGGHMNKITLDMRQNVDLNNGELMEIDKIFSSFSVGAHLQDDLYANKIAFIIALNFPYYTLEEKEKEGMNWSRKEWAAIRMGDQFVSRIPAEVSQQVAKAEADADIYISEYNIQMGSLRTEDGKQLFPDQMSLLTHWNLRDEIKANYADKNQGLLKQKMIYNVMQHIINQDIPANVINNPKFHWRPFSNQVYENSQSISAIAEADCRYQQILNNFHAQQAVDLHVPEMNSLIKRKFSGEMEIKVEDVISLFDHYLRSPELAEVAKVIEGRVSRKLEAFDIWYDGFKARSEFPQEQLNLLTTKKFTNPNAFQSAMPMMLQKLGWSKERAYYLADKIVVDPARGSGHAWGAGMRGEKAHLRTRIASSGMDYKGYNIAVHEFGHNVEQTISLYDMDFYALNGVPNTAFTEALAFIFQSRDLYLLGVSGQSTDESDLSRLDAAWTLMEIMGVGLVDIRTWQWLYAHPNSTASELKNAVITIAKDVWNTYYASIFGIKDQTILSIYSHMISNPLYLAAYSYGQIIEFQLENHLKGKNFPNEIDRIYQQGRLIPQLWMNKAVGSNISVDPILQEVKEALKGVKN